MPVMKRLNSARTVSDFQQEADGPPDEIEVGEVGEVDGIAWATAIGWLAYYGGKALADAISRHRLYVGAAGALFLAWRQLVRRRAA